MVLQKIAYIPKNGLDFDTKEIFFNENSNLCHGTIFEDLNEKQITQSEYILSNLELLDKKARELFFDFYKKEDNIVCPFIDVHFNEYGDEVREEIFEKLQIREQDDRAFLENIEFGKFSISEDDKNDGVWITMDYNLIWEDGWTFTDQVLAIRFDVNLKYIRHMHES